jgi:hypothetical protein
MIVTAPQWATGAADAPESADHAAGRSRHPPGR